MKDAFGKELNINDEVFFVDTYYDDRFGRGYKIGTITGFTDNFAIIEFNKYNRKCKTSRISRRIIKNDSKEINDRYLRLAADVDNYKKNVERRASMEAARGQDRTLLSYIEFMDDLDRALESTYGNNEGLSHIMEKNVNVLRSQFNLISIDEYLGNDKDKFNPDYHEAISTVPTDNKELDNTINATFQKGYIYNDGKLLRIQKVVVYKYNEE